MNGTVKYRHSSLFIGIRALVVVACMAAISVHAQASSCSGECSRRMAECRAERCAGVPKKLCRDRCRAVTGCRAGGARIRTVATVVTDCQVAEGLSTTQQRLEIKRGDCPAEIIMAVDSDPVPDMTDPNTGLASVCESYGRFRDGSSAALTGAFQRLGVSPDGDTVLFEINTHVQYPPFSGTRFLVPQEGVFAVGPRGDVRLLGPASRERTWQVFELNGRTVVGTYRMYFTFSPNGRFVAFSDRGPGEDGLEAAQIVVMKLPSGDRTQVTRFNKSHQGNPTGADVYAVFLDDDTLGVFGYGEPGSGFFTVRPDGSGFEPIVVPPLTGGGSISEMFGVLGAVGTTVAAVFSSERATEPVEGPAGEILLYGGPNRLLQLTRFGRSDTHPGPSLNTGNRVFFTASVDGSADGFGHNPQKACQLFSIDRFGGRLRQLTTFAPQMPSSFGCLGGDSSPLQCNVATTAPPQYDAQARSLVFDGTCDPYGLQPVGGQVFAVRRDGSGLRQLTTYRGMHGTAAASTLSVELPGPIATSGEIN